MNKFFIVGCPRSGTTMLQQALNRHSRIAIPPETKFFFSFFKRSRAAQAGHVARLNRDLRIDLKQPDAAICSLEDGRAFFEEMARQYVAGLSDKKTIAAFGEKTPEHTGHLLRIRQLFPEAKIVLLYRDGRDVALSLARAPWMGGANIYVAFLVWLYYQRLIAQALHSGWPNLYFARYEDIVGRPREELGGILDFLGLPFEPAVADGYGNAEGIPDREFPWKGNALRKITEERVGTFRRELTPTQIGTLERLGKPTLDAFGYSLFTSGNAAFPLGFRCKLAWDVAAFVYRLPWYSLLHEVLDRTILRVSGGIAGLGSSFGSLHRPPVAEIRRV